MTERTRSLKGIVPIPVTTFDPNGDLDLAGMRSQVAFCVDAGAHGILYPGVVSEFYTLTDAERMDAVRACSEEIAGRVPFFVGVSDTGTGRAVSFARHAAEIGADGIMTMTPFVQHFFPPSLDDAKRHLTAIRDACQLPMILQNARIGHPVGIRDLVTLVKEVPGIEYIKQETNPLTHQLTDVLTAVGDRVRGVFGGVGGVYLLNELQRGALGSMPAPPFVDVLVRAHAQFVAADHDSARRTLDPLGTLFTRELLYNAVFIKEVLKRRGLIASARMRMGSPQLDEVDGSELDALLSLAGLIPR